MSIQTITNYLRVSDRVSSSGQPDEEGFRSIAAAGFHAVINLAMPDSEGAIAEEGGIVTQLGMSYHHIPVPFDEPKVSQLTQFFGLMDTLENDKAEVEIEAPCGGILRHVGVEGEVYPVGALVARIE